MHRYSWRIFSTVSHDYNFRSCVREQNAMETKCTMPWHDENLGHWVILFTIIFLHNFYLNFVNLLCLSMDQNWCFSGFEHCSHMEQYDKFEKLSFSLAKNDKTFIENTTNCLYPCTYLEYRIASKEVVNMPGGDGFAISYGSLAVAVRKEVTN